ncbi:MarR family winged helix-turn-helix transcriptional regulator [Marinicrinis lubricantis]|uniref:MarR family winged helix-turn-helix transcriptional regulator n=1 Tax=Marinicrinis lubricantis TaxID=2086470 RepID=A0ABW1IQA0_9BACL
MSQGRSIGMELRTLRNLLLRKVEGVIHKKYNDQLTCMHGWVLKYFVDHQDRDVFQRDLEHEFSIRRSTATKILQLMEKNCLIRRVPVPYDARLKKIVLTPKAIEYHQAVVKSFIELEQELKKGISEEEMDSFFAIMDKLKKNLEQPSSMRSGKF